MKIVAIQALVLIAVVAAVVALARGPVATRWGAAGGEALHAAALIGLGAALLAATPLGIAATYWPKSAPMVAFAGTAVRLFATAGGGMAYEVFAQPQLSAFLASILAVYLALLLAETALIVFIVARTNRSLPKA